MNFGSKEPILTEEAQSEPVTKPGTSCSCEREFPATRQNNRIKARFPATYAESHKSADERPPESSEPMARCSESVRGVRKLNRSLIARFPAILRGGSRAGIRVCRTPCCAFISLSLAIVDDLRRRFARFKLCAHLLDLRCLFSHCRGESLHSGF